MILIFDSEADSLLDTVTKMHCSVFSNYESGKVVEFTDGQKMKSALEKTAKQGDLTLVGHNILGYDLPLFEKLFEMPCTVQPDTLMGAPVQFIDTLVLSRELWPDRPLPAGCPETVYNPVTNRHDKIGSHSLLAWTYRVSGTKPQISDWRDQPLEVYLERCRADVDTTTKVFRYLMKEYKIEL